MEILAAIGLDRRLPDQIAAHGERAEKLIVQIVAIGDDDDGGVFEFGAAHKLAGIEGHQQAFARTLRVPDHADLAVALRRGRLNGFFDCVPHGVELVIARDDLRQGPIRSRQRP